MDKDYQRLYEEVLMTNKTKDYMDKSLRSNTKDSLDLVNQAKNALLGVLLDSTNPIFKGTQPKHVRGAACELMLRYLLEYYFDVRPYNYFLTDNLMIPNNYTGRTTQLDTVVVTNSCILVIECKSLYGISHIKDGVVTNTHNKNRTKPNKPWNQNMGHILSLKEVLSKLNPHYGKIYYYNIVFLFGIGKIEVYEPKEHQILMTIDNSFMELDKAIGTRRYNMLTNNELIHISNELASKSHNLRDEIAHIRNIQQNKE